MKDFRQYTIRLYRGEWEAMDLRRGERSVYEYVRGLVLKDSLGDSLGGSLGGPLRGQGESRISPGVISGTVSKNTKTSGASKVMGNLKRSRKLSKKFPKKFPKGLPKKDLKNLLREEIFRRYCKTCVGVKDFRGGRCITCKGE